MIATVTLNPSLDEWMQLDSLQPGRLNRAHGFARYPGGKGINVSRVVHELGGSTVAFGVAGGEDGLILRELLNRLAIRHAFVEIAGSTRNNYKIVTRRARAVTEINTDGPRVSAVALRALQHRVLHWSPRPVCAALSGSLPPGAPARTYRRWIMRLRRQGVPVALDASGEALRHGLAARPWLIKPNQEEAEALVGHSLATHRRRVKAVRELARRGAAIAILSLGRDGALLGLRDSAIGLPRQGEVGLHEDARGGVSVWWGRAPVMRVDASVGAGDSLVGGFLASWARSRDVLEAFELGIACGTATAMTPGTELCHRRDVMRVLRRVTIRRVG